MRQRLRPFPPAPCARRAALVALLVCGLLVSLLAPPAAADQPTPVAGPPAAAAPTDPPTASPTSAASSASASAGDAGVGAPPNTTVVPAPTTGPATEATLTPIGATVRWQPCAGGDVAPAAGPALQCARVPVPLDHDDPTAASLTLALVRRPATDAAHRIGSLFVNPGGPGGSGVDLVTSTPNLLGAEVQARYDIVGFDPRGVGASSHLDCGIGDDLLADTDPGTLPDAANRAVHERALDDAQLAFGRGLVARCQAEHPDLLATLSTTTAARDLDVLRRAVGDAQLTYLGYSYGSTLGARYAQLHPQQVGRLVLDGIVHPGLTYADWVADQLRSFQSSLERFFAACEREPTCPLHGRSEATWQQLWATSDGPGLPVPGAAPLERAELSEVTVDLLYLGRAFDAMLGGMLATAAAGDASALADIARQGSNLSAAAYYGVVCGDNATPIDASRFGEGLASLAPDAPTFAPALREVLTCAAMPDPATPLPAIALAGPLPQPPLLVATTHDPATPYAGAEAMHAALPGAALLTYDSDGHTVVGRGDRCIDGAVAAYLLNGTLPTDGATCRPTADLGVLLTPADRPGTATVAAVPPGSAAAQVLRAGDVIHSVNKVAVTSPMQLEEAAQRNADVVLDIERDGRAETVTITPVPADYWLP